MKTKQEINALFDHIYSISTADHIELFYEESHSTTTRFANNSVTQNVESEDLHLKIKVAFDNRKASKILDKSTFILFIMQSVIYILFRRNDLALQLVQYIFTIVIIFY